ncbi:MAG: 2-amino-4-hydroxy-6-hydroxymethyldihydropteridine diphosphokinase [Bacteroidales bacterium]|nr:2-amino-4-hydroxy-6-hydroxymethyldihydropteridine diphosphokinase [Bacteroidales bacterium]
MSIYLSLGSNLGDREGNIYKALTFLEDQIGVIRKQSSLYETEPWGMESVTLFLNKVIMIESDFKPFAMLSRIKEIERLAGRILPANSTTGISADCYLSRCIDIDILFYHHQVVVREHLIIPHPKIPYRRFLLVPLAEIASEFVHPVSGKNMQELLNECVDQKRVSIRPMDC